MKYDFQVGDIFYSKISDRIITITKIPQSIDPYMDNDMYRGIYSGETQERPVGYYGAIIEAIEQDEWIYYPIKK